MCGGMYVYKNGWRFRTEKETNTHVDEQLPAKQIEHEKYGHGNI
jgi:hypothetical protein